MTLCNPSSASNLRDRISLSEMGSNWKALVSDKRKRQLDAIPKEWKIRLPLEDRLDVRDVPKESGLLTSKELQITELDDVETLLRNLAAGNWSSVEVTTAYYKRAIIAHQLVCSYKLSHFAASLICVFADQLSN